jgi:hypothetical protein
LHSLFGHSGGHPGFSYTPSSKNSSWRTVTFHIYPASKEKGRKIPLACSEVRRSGRLKLLNKGYWGKTCFDNNCLACAVVAPPVKKSVVRNLCHKFNIQDSIDENEEEEDPPVVKTKSGQRKSSKDDPNASKNKKSTKK